MIHRPIIDAGPGLNFLSINKERLLISILGPLSAPEAVPDEVLRKTRQDDRSTLTVLERAASSREIPDKGAMRDIYHRLRGLDDGLPPIESTNLLSSATWP